MFLNRFLDPLRSFNFKYIISEVLLIFVGISLSLYFDQWRTNRADDKKEKDLLAQLIPAVRRDSIHLGDLIRRNESVSKKMTFLLDSGRFEKAPSKKTILYLAYINHYFPCKPDYSAFENIKHEGISLITSQNLRISIIQYYEEMTGQKEWTENILDGHFAQLNPYIIDDFVDYQWGAEAVPENFEKLKADKRFWKLVSRTRMFCDVTAVQMSDRKKFATIFINQLEQEIAR